ncbi:MAG: carotenoid oxygenase family protein [Cyanobacteria bacterium P01_H01_bin.21]
MVQANLEKTASLVTDWARGYDSQDNEYSYWIDEIEGMIPPELQGTLFRNGVGRLDVNGQKIGHPFDGDGMVCAITFNQGRAHFKNRYVRTEGYLKEQAAGKILYRGFGTQKPGGWLANIFDTNFKNAANTNVIYWGDKLWTMWEGGHPHQLAPDTLETIGEDNINGLLEPEQPFSAHPKIINNSFVNFGVRGITSQTLTIFELDDLGNKLKQYSHPLTGFAFLHDMVITDNYCIFVQHPFQVQGLPFLLGFKTIEQCFDFNSEQPTKIIVISRHGDHELEILETDSFFGFHHGNAWEKDGKIYFESVCSQSFPQKQQAELDFEKMDFDNFPKGELWEFELDLSQKTVNRQKVEERGCEFPTVNPMWVGKEHRYLYMNACGSPTGSGPLQVILKLDKDTGENQVWSPGARGFAGEPIFVSRPNTIKEEDGWLISLVYDAAIHRSYVIILDAQNLDKVVAKLHLKHHIPHGFHGSWTSEVFV